MPGARRKKCPFLRVEIADKEIVVLSPFDQAHSHLRFRSPELFHGADDIVIRAMEYNASGQIAVDFVSAQISNSKS